MPRRSGHLLFNLLAIDLRSSAAEAASPYGLGEPQFEQNLPLLTVPHEHVQSLAGAGLPQLLQNLPVLTDPHSHVQDPAAGAACAGAAAACCAPAIW